MQRPCGQQDLIQEAERKPVYKEEGNRNQAEVEPSAKAARLGIGARLVFLPLPLSNKKPLAVLSIG